MYMLFDEAAYQILLHATCSLCTMYNTSIYERVDVPLLIAQEQWYTNHQSNKISQSQQSC